jgi:hypothetical protein
MTAPFWIFLIIVIFADIIAILEWFDRDVGPAWKAKLKLWLHRRRSDPNK